MTGIPLTSTSRSNALQRLAASVEPGQELDVLVIGGGITGAGIALDAATRGLSTIVVEAQDWASGTSSRASKLVHGGLRYLQMLDFKLVHEALSERDLLLTTVAPHLVRPLPFLYPLKHRLWERAFVGAGIALYDCLAAVASLGGGGRRAVPWHRHLSRRGVERVFPSIAPSAAIGAIEYWDANVDDARYVLTTIRTAVDRGAGAASRTQVTRLTKDADGRVNGAIVVDLETGTSIPVRARSVISSTGVWTQESQELAGATEGGLRVLASKGVHIVVPRERIAGTVGLIVQTEKSVLFVIPWSRYWVIGTTDTPWTEDLVNPVATSDDIDYLIAKANEVIDQPIGRSDIVGTWAGLRPLLQPATAETTSSAKVSREHTVASPVPGLVVIAGGKFTTYRVMARDAVDFVLGKDARRRPSVTRTVPLLGATGIESAERELRSAAERFGWSDQLVDHLLHRFGANTREIAELCIADESMAVPLAGAPAYLRAEVQYAISHEGAMHLEDILVRRTRIVYEYAGAGLDVLDEVAAIAAPLLGWSEEQTEREVQDYTAIVLAERAAADESDDASAMRMRDAAGDVVPMVGRDSTDERKRSSAGSVSKPA